MDKQERQELEQNDLADFLINFRGWWDKHGTTTLLGVLLIVGGFVGYRYFTGQAEGAKQEAWAAFYAAGTPEAMQQVAQTHADRASLAALARVNAADSLLVQGIFHDQMVAAGVEVEADADPIAMIANAETLYLDVINTTPSDENLPSLAVLRARFGLGTIYEQQDKIEDARKQYQQILDGAGPYQYLTTRARLLMADLDRVAEPVTFAEESIETLDLTPATGAEIDGVPSTLIRPASDSPSGGTDDEPAANDDGDADSDEPTEATAPTTQPAE